MDFARLIENAAAPVVVSGLFLWFMWRVGTQLITLGANFVGNHLSSLTAAVRDLAELTRDLVEMHRRDGDK